MATATTLPMFNARSAAMLAQRLEKARTNLFSKFTPAAAFIEKLGRKVKVSNGQYIVFMAESDPGNLFEIVTGRERVRHGERDGGKNAREVLSGFAYTYDFFDIDAQIFADEDGFKEYVASQTRYRDEAIARELVKQFLMGNSTTIPGFTTLNGDVTYNPMRTGAQQGILRFEAPSAQTSTTHNLARSEAYNWYNQYRVVTSMAANGPKQIAGLRRDCSRELSDTPVDSFIMITDDASFENIVNTYAENVVYAEIPTDGQPDYMPTRQGVKVFGVDMWSDRYLTPSGFATAEAQEGVGYLLQPSYWLRLQPANGQEETSDVVDMTEQFGSTVRLRRMFNFMTEDLRCQGAITGTNRA